jgi:diguanylate cyclase (GGDEF)-like protein
MTKAQSNKRSLVKLYVLTILLMGLGSGLALQQNWTLHLAANQIQLARDASITSDVIDSALIAAAKSLDLAKADLTAAIYLGKSDQANVYRILTRSVTEFIRYTPADVYGLLFFVDKHGQLFARSGEYPSKHIDFTDRYYYQDLRDNPSKTQTIGPIVKARTTGKYVFHIAEPIFDKHHKFYGVLVQQIETDNLSVVLDRSLDGLTEMVILHHQQDGISFTYPTTQNHEAPINIKLIEQSIRPSNLIHGCITIKDSTLPEADSLLIGFDKSSQFGLIISASLPLKSVVKNFILISRHLLIYILFGAALVSYLFWQLYQQFSRLEVTQYISRHDALTKLHNRWALDSELPILMHEAMRRHTPISFLFIDIDHFKNINDIYGHKMGDVVLSSVAQAIDQCLRRPLDFLCRWGGEEFLVVMSDTSEDSAVKIAESMMAAVKHTIITGVDLSPAISIGIKTLVITSENINDNHLMDAEQAMMLAKQNGRNRYEIFRSEA